MKLQLTVVTLGMILAPIPQRHIQQLPQHCLLAATAQIAWALDYRALSLTYPAASNSWDATTDWASTNLPPAYQHLWSSVQAGTGAIISSTPPGVGLLIIMRPAGTTHAVSYAAGLIYDPKQPDAAFSSLAAFLGSTPHYYGSPVYAYPAP